MNSLLPAATLAALPIAISASALSPVGRFRLFPRFRAEFGLAAIGRELACNAELAWLFQGSQSNMSYAIGGLRQRLRDREHEID